MNSYTVPFQQTLDKIQQTLDKLRTVKSLKASQYKKTCIYVLL